MNSKDNIEQFAYCYNPNYGPEVDSPFNYYPGLPEDSITATSLEDVGLGAHTDIQSFTILWQDMIGGLQVLMADGSWVKAPPIPGTFVVNIGDYLMRLSNDRFKSTFHRVFMRTTSDRYSMPFFIGFNCNEEFSVLPSYTSEDMPAKYEPTSCGEYVRCRLNYIYIPPRAQGAHPAT
ncbi:hypothetical protein LTS17_006111 [Exophiala oligosperma]